MIWWRPQNLTECESSIIVRSSPQPYAWRLGYVQVGECRIGYRSGGYLGININIFISVYSITPYKTHPPNSSYSGSFWYVHKLIELVTRWEFAGMGWWCRLVWSQSMFGTSRLLNLHSKIYLAFKHLESKIPFHYCWMLFDQAKREICEADVDHGASYSAAVALLTHTNRLVIDKE